MNIPNLPGTARAAVSSWRVRLAIGITLLNLFAWGGQLSAGQFAVAVPLTLAGSYLWVRVLGLLWRAIGEVGRRAPV